MASFRNEHRMLKKASFSPAQPRHAKTRRSTGKAAASEGARRTLRYVEPLSDARTPLEDFFSILLNVALLARRVTKRSPQPVSSLPGYRRIRNDGILLGKA